MKKNIRPVSYSIEQYYIDSFLRTHKEFIMSNCLVIVCEDTLLPIITKNVAAFDTLRITVEKKPTITNPIKELNQLISKTYDTVIAINLLNSVFDYESAIYECMRILKPQGTLLTTLQTVTPPKNYDHSIWGFTEASVRFIFNKHFTAENHAIKGYGNVLTGRFLLDDLTSNKLTPSQLDYYDPYFPIIIGVKASQKN